MVQHVELVPDVEVVGRLVQDQDAGFLDQGPRDHGTLALAAGHLVERAVRQVNQAERVERGQHELAVACVFAVEALFVREPAERGHLGGGEVELGRAILGNHGDALR